MCNLYIDIMHAGQGGHDVCTVKVGCTTTTVSSTSYVLVLWCPYKNTTGIIVVPGRLAAFLSYFSEFQICAHNNYKLFTCGITTKCKQKVKRGHRDD